MTIGPVPLFDMDLIAENWGSPDNPLYRSILEIFRQEADELLSAIEAADREGRAADRDRASHTLKGAASNVGALRVALSTDATSPCVLRDAVEATLIVIGEGGPVPE